MFKIIDKSVSLLSVRWSQVLTNTFEQQIDDKTVRTLWTQMWYKAGDEKYFWFDKQMGKMFEMCMNLISDMRPKSAKMCQNVPCHSYNL